MVTVAVAANLRSRSRSVTNRTPGSSWPWHARSYRSAKARATARRDFVKKKNQNYVFVSLLYSKKKKNERLNYETDIVSRDNNTTSSSGVYTYDKLSNARWRFSLVRFFFFFPKSFYDILKMFARTRRVSTRSKPGRYVWRMRYHETACGT